MTKMRTRFAPSPTGYMHVGNLRTALFTYLLARHAGGTFILRLEDTDTEREVAGADQLIYRTLREVHLDYDEGPDVGGDYGPYIQSQRKHIYAPHAWQLVERGHAYPCFCTKQRLDELREQAEARGETFKYDKHCLHNVTPEQARARIDAGEPYVIRQNVPTTGTTSFEDVLYGTITVQNDTLDDNVLLKSDGLPTYNFANVVDDHTMGITHVMRGTEYLSSSPKYNLLYQAFGWPVPVYLHVTPVMKNAQRKLSKRHGDPTFEDLREMGYLDDAIMNYIALLGWSPGNDREFFTLSELVEAFEVRGISRSPSIFDMNKLTWFNAEYIRKLPFERYCELAMPYLAQAIDPAAFDCARILALLQGRTEVLSQVPQMVDFLAAVPDYDVALYTHKKMKTDAQVARQGLALAASALAAVTDWRETVIHDALMAAIAEGGMKNGQVLWPLRIALSGKESTPGGAVEIAYLLGRQEALSRIASAQSKLADGNA